MSGQAQYRPGSGPASPDDGTSQGSLSGSGAASDYEYDSFDAGVGVGGGPEGSLEETIPGIPGDDYPIFAEVPDTSFLCDGQVDGGYYADPEADCQAFHICAGDGTGSLTRYSFLCPNGTLFNQQYFVCDWWFNVDCSIAEDLYSLNDDIAAEREANSPGEGQGQYAGGNGGRNGGRRGNSGGARRGSASSPAGSYAAPPSYGVPEEEELAPADAGYGAPRYEGRRRNARELVEES